ncbi:conserved Plasmodium protein, unknown function [Plasmodium ovale]|uniref:Uncharacterized protein n=2 Tax=Plasmodium ovale TaxID=36330 RepID=A0A1A8VRG9_PLAOA|nr:conserved Plasmodium protein, unknown function [Plasmodium ovale curtisi]SBS83801.1 conserved Plasmodium protein, unknown function [Plasmodium ovale curtisi]SCP03828.1 conserved Plasmodium protein, unknown function [Plasmodium ovale]
MNTDELERSAKDSFGEPSSTEEKYKILILGKNEGNDMNMCTNTPLAENDEEKKNLLTHKLDRDVEDKKQQRRREDEGDQYEKERTNEAVALIGEMLLGYEGIPREETNCEPQCGEKHDDLIPPMRYENKEESVEWGTKKCVNILDQIVERNSGNVERVNGLSKGDPIDGQLDLLPRHHPSNYSNDKQLCKEGDQGRERVKRNYRVARTIEKVKSILKNSEKYTYQNGSCEKEKMSSILKQLNKRDSNIFLQCENCVDIEKKIEEEKMRIGKFPVEILKTIDVGSLVSKNNSPLPFIISGITETLEHILNVDKSKNKNKTRLVEIVQNVNILMQSYYNLIVRCDSILAFTIGKIKKLYKTYREVHKSLRGSKGQNGKDTTKKLGVFVAQNAQQLNYQDVTTEVVNTLGEKFPFEKNPTDNCISTMEKTNSIRVRIPLTNLSDCSDKYSKYSNPRTCDEENTDTGIVLSNEVKAYTTNSGKHIDVPEVIDANGKNKEKGKVKNLEKEDNSSKGVNWQECDKRSNAIENTAGSIDGTVEEVTMAAVDANDTETINAPEMVSMDENVLSQSFVKKENANFKNLYSIDSKSTAMSNNKEEYSVATEGEEKRKKKQRKEKRKKREMEKKKILKKLEKLNAFFLFTFHHKGDIINYLQKEINMCISEFDRIYQLYMSS